MILVSEQPGRAIRQQGFTLIEVLVAVSIIAIGLTGILTTINGMVNSSSYLRDKTLANWVGQNHIAELRLDSDWPDIGKRTADVEMANQEWRIATEISATPVEKLRRIDVSVSYLETPDNPLIVIAAFVGEPQSSGQDRGWREGARSTINSPVGNPGPDDEGDGQDDGT